MGKEGGRSVVGASGGGGGGAAAVGGSVPGGGFADDDNEAGFSCCWRMARILFSTNSVTDTLISMPALALALLPSCL